MTIIISVVVGIAMIAAAGNGEWGSVAVGAVIVVLLMALGSASRENDRAYNNVMEYWERGGPNRRHQTHR